jgi:hypothetical protein
MKALTPTQAEFLSVTSGLVGQTFDVATSQYSCSKATAYWNGYKTHCTVAALRGLEKRGFIKVDLFFWRGATVKRLK